MADTKKIDPFDVEALEKSLNDSATRVSTIWVSFLIFSLYLLIAATTVTHRQLFLAEPVKLPVLNIDLPLWGFFWLAPILFVVFHAYVLIQLILLARTAGAYDAAVAKLIEQDNLSPEANVSLRQRLANTLFAQILAGSPREREGWFGSLLKAMAWITLVIAPIITLLTFQFMFLPYHSHLATWTHRFLILLEFVVAFKLWPLVLNPQREFEWPSWRRRIGDMAFRVTELLRSSEGRQPDGQGLRLLALPMTAGILFVLLSLSFGTFPGEPHVNLFTGQPLTSVGCGRWLHQSFEHTDLRFDRLIPLGYFVDDEKVAKAEKAISDRKLAPWAGEPARSLRNRDLNCITISGDLRHVDFTGAHFLGATMFFVDLQGANLSDARFQGAYLNGTKFRGVLLFRTQFQGAVLRAASFVDSRLVGTQFQGANLSITSFQGGQLEEVQLQGAFLEGARLQGASFINAQLQGSILDGAHLEGAWFKDVWLQGASLKSAQLQGAMLDGVHLQGADFMDTVLDYSLLSNVWVWRTANLNCTEARVIDRKLDDVIETGADIRVGGRFRSPTLRPMLHAKATPAAISTFIERSVAEIPDTSLTTTPTSKKAVAIRMHRGFEVDPAQDDAQAFDKESKCQGSVPREQFDRAHAELLRKLVCDDLKEERKAVVENIVANWISETEDRRAFSAQLAKGLLGEDGKPCAAAKDYDEDTKTVLRGAAGPSPAAIAPK
ncbi:pentapeptide repeat-containing protein [Bradyrhizobium sp.]|jgi:uncharacterized protein YjbI with pentapeptide repeats|uniref:pentapeptide repeat-containing protein n=1 Tax=Bradyrhizobium sp. TaxID=376 RepID=UPI002E069EAA|nr:pentapeptide repeat-containing protein [Bradyrhizobium sp.]